MIKEIEYNDGESRLKGHVEILPDGEGMYTITSYIEDKVYGSPWYFVRTEDVMTIQQKQITGIGKVLKKMADGYKSKNIFDQLQDKGFSAP